MNRRTQRIGLTIIIILMLTAACDAVIGEPIVQIPGIAETFAAHTLAAHTQMVTIVPVTSTPSPTPNTNRNVNPGLSNLANQEATPEITLPPTSTPLPSLTPDPLAPDSPGDPFAIDPNAPCNAAEYIRDVTIPDNTIVKPKEKFTKIWAIRNVGTCTWKKDEYAMVLNWGAEMGTDRFVPLAFDVKPGQTAELAIDMEAPAIPSCWQSNWMLQDGEGNRFGVGPYYGNYFWVLVSVWWPGVPKFSSG